VSGIPAGSHPRLRPGCRLSESVQQGDVLLIPEGVLRLVGPGRKIIEHCDGQRTVDDIVRELTAEFPTVEPGRIATEVTTFLDRLHQKGVLDLG
jgi:pyrroloquinoline quinone biosynthesis protein D